ncbi:MAG: MSHA pilin protein MshC [Methylophagaceae bacterium]|jgi:MSHA pilin protein MshC
MISVNVRPKYHCGFTLVELVMVIVILTIMSAVALPRFFERSTFQDRAVYDDIVNTLRYAQKIAVASGCPTQFQYVPATSTYQVMQEQVCNNDTFDQIVTNPATHSTLTNTLNGTPFNTTTNTITFFALGNVSTSATLTVASKAISVENQTGFVNAQ